jgi:hypothetical protein
MIGITIGTGEYYSRLAKLAARAVEEKTGIKTVILGDERFAASGLPAPHHLKLRMFDFVDDESVMYFDADMVCLNSWKPESLAKADAVVAVAESARPLHVRTAQDWEIPLGEYFNAGLLLLNRRAHEEWLRETERFVQTDTKFAEYDPYDQAALNITRHRLGLKLELLDRRYNWIGYGGSKLSYEVPVFMAHGLHPENKFANVDFFEGRYKPPFNWRIRVDENKVRKLKGRTLRLRAGRVAMPIRLNRDGTIGPPYFPGEGQYWFVQDRSGEAALEICSEVQILQEFKEGRGEGWRSVQRLEQAVA